MTWHLASNFVNCYNSRMAYKNIDDRKAASKRHYQANKLKYIERNKRYREHIRNIVREIKDNTACADCNKNFPYYVMDFDHIEETKSDIVSYLAKTGRIGALRQEIKKCEVVCANCHRERTHIRLIKSNLPA